MSEKTAIEGNRQKVKQWVVLNAAITKPYRSDWQTRPKNDQRWWSASTTLTYDIYGLGETIEQAYEALTDEIVGNSAWYSYLITLDSFKEIIKL